MNSRIAKALDLKPGDRVKAAADSEGPAFLKAGRRYEVVRLERYHERRDPVPIVSSVDIVVIDDKGWEVSVPYTTFKYN